MRENKSKILTIVIVSIILLLFAIALSYAKNGVKTKEISYNEFVNLLDKNQISKVSITNENLLITTIESNAEYKGITLITHRIHDEDLISQIEEDGVAINKNTTNETKIFDMILSWIVVITIIVLLWRNYYLKKQNKQLLIQIKDLINKNNL